jgi:hypothetical protein
MNNIFKKIGVTITKENKKDIDGIFHSIVGIKYKNCSATWKEVKKKIADNEGNFANALKSALEKT